MFRYVVVVFVGGRDAVVIIEVLVSGLHRRDYHPQLAVLGERGELGETGAVATWWSQCCRGVCQ